MEGYEEVYAPEETADQEEAVQEGTGTDPEEPEADQDESREEETGEEQPEEEAGETGADPEEEVTEEDPEEDPETVSGNDLVVRGDVVIFPEGYSFPAPEGEPTDTESVVQAVERQSDIMTAGFTCTCFMLGVLAGALVITGFRLGRV